MYIVLLLSTFVFAEPLRNLFTSPLGKIVEGDHKKILHRYDPSSSVLTNRKAVEHPNKGNGPSILLTVAETTYLAVLIDGIVSFDCNQNGIIEPQEKAKMTKVGKEYRGRFPVHDLVPEVPHIVFLSTNLQSNLGYIKDMKKRGVLWDGTPFYIHSVNGVFQHRDAEIVLDVNQDTVSDVHHVLYKGTLGKGSIHWDGGLWRPDLSKDGTHIRWMRVGDALLDVGKAVPTLETVDVRNKKRVIGGVSKKATILDFWATWCASCVRDHKKLKKLERMYDVSIVGLADNSKREIRRYMKKRRIRWPQISVQEHPQIQEIYPVDALPRYVLIDSAGILRFMGTMKGLERELEQL